MHQQTPALHPSRYRSLINSVPSQAQKTLQNEEIRKEPDYSLTSVTDYNDGKHRRLDFDVSMKHKTKTFSTNTYIKE